MWIYIQIHLKCVSHVSLKFSCLLIVPAFACFACFACFARLVFFSAGLTRRSTVQYLPRSLFYACTYYIMYTFPLLIAHPDRFSYPHVLTDIALLLFASALLLCAPPCCARLRFVCRINKAYYLPRWCSTADYVKYFEAEGLVDIKRDDWTDNIQVLLFDNERTWCSGASTLSSIRRLC